MEQPLKARLIGASILVVLAVALVPELLSGPKDLPAGAATPGSAKGTRTFTIDLNGTGATGARAEPRPDAQSPATTPPALPQVDAPAPEPATPTATVADESAPTADTPPPEPVVAPAATAAAKPVPKPATTTTPAPAAPQASGYSVQVGAFGSDDTARKLVNELKADGLPAYVAPLSKAGKTLHRVRVGPVADRAAADKLAATLKARKLPVSVVSGG